MLPHHAADATRRETYLAVRPQTNLEQRLDVISHDLGFGARKHAEDDDGTPALELGDGLVGACE